MVTPQQSADFADLALRQWQSLRALPPEDRIEALMANFFAPPPITEAEYEIILRNVATEMANA